MDTNYKYMKNIKSLILISILTLTFQGLFAQGVVSVKEMLAQKDAIIVSAQNASVFISKAHVKNAVNIDIHDLQTDVPYKGKLKSTSDLANLFGKKGISQTSKIIIYDKGDMKYAGRLYWVFKYMGVSDVKVLNGGIKAYMAARKPITKVVAKPKAVTFTPKLNKDINVDKAYVKSKVSNSGTILLDVRSAEEFGDGSCNAAVNIEFKQVIDANGKIKSKEELLALFKAKGITGNKEIIVFCATSVRAGIVYLVLKDVLNFSNVKVFEGAYNQWKTS